MKFPAEFKVCEGCSKAQAIVDGNTLVCSDLWKLRSVAFCKLYKREEEDGRADGDNRVLPDIHRDGPVPDMGGR